MIGMRETGSVGALAAPRCGRGVAHRATLSIARDERATKRVVERRLQSGPPVASGSTAHPGPIQAACGVMARRRRAAACVDPPHGAIDVFGPLRARSKRRHLRTRLQLPKEVLADAPGVQFRPGGRRRVRLREPSADSSRTSEGVAICVYPDVQDALAIVAAAEGAVGAPSKSAATSRLRYTGLQAPAGSRSRRSSATDIAARSCMLQRRTSHRIGSGAGSTGGELRPRSRAAEMGSG